MLRTFPKNSLIIKNKEKYSESVDFFLHNNVFKHILFFQDNED